MTLFFGAISILWFIRTSKALLFWVYLWQLKEYHIGRFLDHFNTEKGESLLVNPLVFIKIIIFFILFLSSQIGAYLLLLLYAGETVQFARGILKKGFLKPVRTAKTVVLVGVGLIAEVVFLWISYTMFRTIFVFALLALDIFFPIIASLIVLVFQPFAVIGRNRIIKKAKQKREQFKDLKVIGITGSYGKTSTKEFLSHILSQKYRVLKTQEHKNSEIGIANCILRELKPEHEVFVCEMGAYTRGGIKLLASIAKPSIGVLTGINEQHMATFGSQENIIKTKYELIESLPSDGIAFFNGKNKYCVELYSKTNVKKILYGQEARFRGEENILGAMAISKELGMTDQEIQRAVAGIDNTMPGIKIEAGIGGLKIIDATYSANPDGVIANLEYLKTLPGKKIIVMPCLIELGKTSKEVHKKIGEKIAEVCDLAIITTADRFADIKDGAKGSEKIVFIENVEEIVQRIKSTTQSDDVVLLEGRISNILKDLFFENERGLVR